MQRRLGKPQGPALEHVLPYTLRLSPPHGGSLRLDFLGYDQLLGASQ